MYQLLAGLLGAGGSIASGIMGANAADEAQQTNWKIALLNYYARNRERRERIAQMQKTDRENKLGVTDTEGNRMRFVPGKGWVSELSEKSQQLQDAQRAEQMNVLQKDLPMRRRFMERNETRSREDEVEADTLRRQMRNLRPGSDSELEALLYGSATNRMGEAYDDATEVAARESARTGSSNIGKVLASLSEQRAKSFGDAAMEAKLRARGSADQEFEQKRNSLANLYNMFATRASVAPDVSYKPQSVGGSADKLLSQLSKQGLSAGAALGDAFGQKGGTMDYMQANNGWANAVGSGSSALASLFRNMGKGGDGWGSSSYDKDQTRYRGDDEWG